MAGSPQILYPHLRGDLDANPQLLDALNKLAARLGKVFNVTSGRRTDAEQVQLYNHPQGYPVAKPRSLGGAGSNHESGDAADVTVNGQPIQNAIAAATLRAAGLEPLAGDAVHVELPNASRGDGGGSGVGGALANAAQLIPGVGPAVSAGLAASVGGVSGNPAADAANAAAKATAKAIVGLLVDSIGADGARVLLSIGLAGGALVLIGVGAARAAGVKPSSMPVPLPPPAAALAAAIK